ncbi:hypothetical protein LRS13_10175 [Svornostia abyssi]|uniref:Uncharacterized protein n=1 Tax=Svornostia abyssi TaxID=2898438 RepID=A0ABY5PME2_9ACTN|nr:hypothetical protein LRS13_10175 [Parviterribacteraceae bacterium J379]
MAPPHPEQPALSPRGYAPPIGAASPPPEFTQTAPAAAPERLRYVLSVVAVAYLGMVLARLGASVVGVDLSWSSEDLPTRIDDPGWHALETVSFWTWETAVFASLVWLLDRRTAPLWCGLVGAMLALGLGPEFDSWLLVAGLIGFLAYEIVWTAEGARPFPWRVAPRLTAAVAVLAALGALTAMGATASRYSLAIDTQNSTEDAAVFTIRNTGEKSLELTGMTDRWGGDLSGPALRVRTFGDRPEPVAVRWPLAVDPGGTAILVVDVARTSCPAWISMSDFRLTYERAGPRAMTFESDDPVTLECKVPGGRSR